jgi:hypothetical protein
VIDFSVLADRDCLIAFAAVVLCSDRGVEAHQMGYDHGGIAHLTAKGAAGRTGLSQAASGRALRRLEEAGLIISDGDDDAWRTSASIFAGAGDASPGPGQDIVPETTGAGTKIAGDLPGKPIPPPVAALMEQFGMTEADVLALAMSSPGQRRLEQLHPRPGRRRCRSDPAQAAGGRRPADLRPRSPRGRRCCARSSPT